MINQQKIVYGTLEKDSQMKFRKNLRAYLYHQNISMNKLAKMICEYRKVTCTSSVERSTRRIVSTGRKTINLSEAEEIANVLRIDAGDLCFLNYNDFVYRYCTLQEFAV